MVFSAVSGILVLPGSRKPLIEISYMVCCKYDFLLNSTLKILVYFPNRPGETRKWVISCCYAPCLVVAA